jgi:hypothetical protein
LHHDAILFRQGMNPMRTTLDIPEREHALFTHLAREKHTSFSKLVLELALRGLKTPALVAEEPAKYEIDPETGLAVFSSGHPVTLEDVKALEDEELDGYGPFA